MLALIVTESPNAPVFEWMAAHLKSVGYEVQAQSPRSQQIHEASLLIYHYQPAYFTNWQAILSDKRHGAVGVYYQPDLVASGLMHWAPAALGEYERELQQLMGWASDHGRSLNWFTASDQASRQLAHWGISKQKITALPTPIDLSANNQKQQPLTPHNQTVALLDGYFRPQSTIALLTMAQTLVEQTNASLLWLSPDDKRLAPYENWLSKQLEDRGLSGNTRFLKLSEWSFADDPVRLTLTNMASEMFHPQLDYFRVHGISLFSCDDSPLSDVLHALEDSSAQRAHIETGYALCKRNVLFDLWGAHFLDAIYSARKQQAG